MKILNSISKYVFDTEDIHKKEEFDFSKPLLVKNALHQHHMVSDFEYLRKYFPKDHDIFYCFSNAYYYVIKND